MSINNISPDITQLIDTFGYLIVASGIGIESIGIPFPGETILIAASVYAGAGHLSIFWVIVSAASGAIIGDNVGYTLGRYEGRRLLTKFGKYFKIYPRHLKYAERYFKRFGDKTVFFGRFIAILRIWAAALAGVNKMKWKTFLLYNALGGITWATFYGIIGYYLGENLPLLFSVLRSINKIGICLFGLVIVTVVIITIRKRFF